MDVAEATALLETEELELAELELVDGDVPGLL